MGFFLVKHGMTLGGILLFISFVTLALAVHDYNIVYDVHQGNAGIEYLSQIYLGIYSLEGLMLFRFAILALFVVSIAILVISYKQRRKIYA